MRIRRYHKSRLLSHVLAAASALLCISVAILWLRCDDNMGSDEIELTWKHGFAIHSIADRIFLSIFWNPQFATPRYPSFNFGRDYNESSGFWSYVVMRDHGHSVGPFGFASLDLRPINDAFRPDVREIMFPHWFLMAVLLLLPIRSVAVALVRRHRLRSGRCVECGYDIRAASARCPECGATLASQVVS